MYKGRYFIRQQSYICGDYMEILQYPVFQKAGKRRSRCKPTSEIQRRLNQKNREMRLIRLIHTNFTEEDMALHLTYRDNPSEKTAKKAITSFLRRLKRKMAKKGIKLKYILTTEKGKKTGRVHHHLIINGGLDRDEIERLWGNGLANSKRLQFGPDGVSGLAVYMTKRDFTYKAWSASKNLKRPEPTVKDGAVTANEMERAVNAIESKNEHSYFEGIYAGYELTHAQYSKNAVNRGDYIYAMMRKKEQRPMRRHGLIRHAKEGRGHNEL